ncbi:hypothetical protein C8F04DRAFT_1186748 [Mycena alexandri]|uniref:Uncharacterized protein n=1 Tax=Mycena alexandri TaxID=1745969 RepID=A0AAD6X377_9AGAR|nr:hypothetical protein C8F04DRAFT_1186748 [Mycena alexandri]
MERTPKYSGNPRRVQWGYLESWNRFKGSHPPLKIQSTRSADPQNCGANEVFKHASRVLTGLTCAECGNETEERAVDEVHIRKKSPALLTAQRSPAQISEPQNVPPTQKERERLRYGNAYALTYRHMALSQRNIGLDVREMGWNVYLGRKKVVGGRRGDLESSISFTANNSRHPERHIKLGLGQEKRPLFGRKRYSASPASSSSLVALRHCISFFETIFDRNIEGMVQYSRAEVAPLRKSAGR